MDTQMEYRYLGPSGIKVSVISFGNWLNSDSEKDSQNTIDCVKRAWEMGINFFDTAESYGFGQAQVQMGRALKNLNVPRQHLVVSTKIFFAESTSIPNTRGLSRKHILEGARNSLKRLQLDYVDVIFCHRPDPITPMEEVCRAFDWLIRKGKAFYWGTSEWGADDISQAHYVCQKYNLAKPIVQQPQYNLINRQKMEFDYQSFFEQKQLGTTIWSPLLGGILTGKYNKELPQVHRFTKFQQNIFIVRMFEKYLVHEKEKTLQKLNAFADLATQLGCTMAQLAMAWVINNPDVSTAITGASSPRQLEDTVKALNVRKSLTPEIQSRIEKIFKTVPEGKMNFLVGKKSTSRRFKVLGYE